MNATCRCGKNHKRLVEGNSEIGYTGGIQLKKSQAYTRKFGRAVIKSWTKEDDWALQTDSDDDQDAQPAKRRKQ